MCRISLAEQKNGQMLYLSFYWSNFLDFWLKMHILMIMNRICYVSLSNFEFQNFHFFLECRMQDHPSGVEKWPNTALQLLLVGFASFLVQNAHFDEYNKDQFCSNFQF